MPGPVAGVVVRYAVTRVGSFVGRKALTTFGKKTASKRMQAEAAKRGGIALAPAPQGPFVGPLYHAHDYMSRVREDTVRSSRVPGPVETPKTMGGPSAQTKPGASRNKPRGMISLANRRGPATSRERRPRSPKALPYRKGGCPPGYRYDRRKKMCIRTS